MYMYIYIAIYILYLEHLTRPEPLGVEKEVEAHLRNSSQVKTPNHPLTHGLPFKRDCLISRVMCTNRSSFCPIHHPHCQHYCTTVARRLRNIQPPSGPPCVCHTPYNIGHGLRVNHALHLEHLARPEPLGVDEEMKTHLHNSSQGLTLQLRMIRHG